LTPEVKEINEHVSGGFIVAKREFEGGGQVNPEEDTVLEGFKGFIINVGVGSVLAHGLEDGSVKVTSLVVFSVREQVVNWGPRKVPVSKMSLIEALEDVFSRLVEVADVHGDEEVLVILAVEDTLDRGEHGGVQSNDFSNINVGIRVVTSREGTSEVVESLEVLEIGFSGNIVPAGDGVGLGKVESSPDSIVIIVEVENGSINGSGGFLRV